PSSAQVQNQTGALGGHEDARLPGRKHRDAKGAKAGKRRHEDKEGDVKSPLHRTASGDVAYSFIEEVVDQGLVGLGLFGGHAAKLAEQLGGNADGDELLGVAGGGASDAASAAELGIGGFGNVREIDSAIRNRLCALCVLPGAR